MQRIRRRRNLIVSLVFAAAFVALGIALFWPVHAFPHDIWAGTLRPWLVSNGDLLRAFAAIFSISGFFIGLLLRRSNKAAELREASPLAPVTLSELVARYGRGFTVPWQTRGLFYPVDLEFTPRIVLTGRARQGKTRAAVELMRETIAASLVGEGQIYEPNPYAFSARSAATLVQQIKMTVDAYSPLLIFIDDLPVHFTGLSLPMPKPDPDCVPDDAISGEVNDLQNLSAALKALSSHRMCYVIATARPSQMQNGIHRQWLEREGFEEVALRDITPEQHEQLFAAAAEKWDLEVDPLAAPAIRAQYTGAAGVPIRIVGLHAASKHGSRVTGESVNAVMAALNGREPAVERKQAKARNKPRVNLLSVLLDSLRERVESIRSFGRRIAAFFSHLRFRKPKAKKPAAAKATIAVPAAKEPAAPEADGGAPETAEFVVAEPVETVANTPEPDETEPDADKIEPPRKRRWLGRFRRPRKQSDSSS